MNIPLDIANWLQFNLRELAEDDTTCAGVISGRINSIPDYTPLRWQFGVDMIFRCIKCGLLQVPYFDIDCHDETSFLLAIRSLDPFGGSDGMMWNGTFLRGTEKLKILIDKYFPAPEPYDSTVNPSFIEAVEDIFARHGLPWSEAPMFPILPASH